MCLAMCCIIVVDGIYMQLGFAVLVHVALFLVYWLIEDVTVYRLDQ